MEDWDFLFLTMSTWAQRGLYVANVSWPHICMHHFMLPNFIFSGLSGLSASNTSLPVAFASSVSLHFLLHYMNKGCSIPVCVPLASSKKSSIVVVQMKP